VISIKVGRWGLGVRSCLLIKVGRQDLTPRVSAVEVELSICLGILIDYGGQDQKEGNMRRNTLRIVFVVAIASFFPLKAHATGLKIGSCGYLSTGIGITYFHDKVGVEYLACTGSDGFMPAIVIFGSELDDEDTIFYQDSNINLLYSLSGEERNGAHAGIGLVQTSGELRNSSTNITVKDSSSGISVFLGYDYGWFSGRVGLMSGNSLEFDTSTGGNPPSIETLERNGLFQLFLNIPL
jgi:hypothetical protein